MRNKFNSKGLIAEQFAAQHLNFIEGGSYAPQLFYWPRDRGKVKAVGAGHIKSAFYFCHEKKCENLIRLSLLEYGTELGRHKIKQSVVPLNIVNLPLYAVEKMFCAFENNKK
ncbi:MAG: hypothetical protein WD025_06985 [Bacteriovoracaceae bacterium]